jgi:hypothetical protein
MSAEKKLSSFNKYPALINIIYKPFELSKLIGVVNSYVTPNLIDEGRVISLAFGAIFLVFYCSSVFF